jgi:hypothetical protein
MERFPLTKVASLGGDVCGARYDQWRTRLVFDEARPLHREHVPEFVEVERAELVVQGVLGRYEAVFPRKRWRLEVGDGPLLLDVREGLAVGRHNFEVRREDGGHFSAELNVALRRPTVPVRDGGYVIATEAMKYSHAHWLEDDRAAQRVGRFSVYVKTIPQHFDGTDVRARVSLNGEWKFRPVTETCIDDCSRPDFDDSAWATIDVPHTWPAELARHDGPVWYRRWIDVPADLLGGTTVLRFDGIDDDALVYLNAHEVGYSCGWHRPFQVDASDAATPGRNLLAVLVRSRRASGRGSGMTYGFVRDYAIVDYPDRDEPVGGIYGRHNELARVGHLGPVIFEPRVYPKSEGLVRVSFCAEVAGRSEPLVMGEGSRLVYRPPLIEYANLHAGGESGFSLRCAAGCEADVIRFEGAAQAGACGPVARIEVFPFKYRQAVTIERTPLGARITGADTGEPLEIVADAGCDATIEMDEARTGFEQCHVVTVSLQPDAAGRFALTLLCGQPGADAGETTIAAVAQRWEELVYSCARPLRMSDEFAAALRTWKQALTLCSQIVADRPAGLITDLIKYPIFWLRDAAFSVPGALYAGAAASRAALATAGELFGTARQNIGITVINPDGVLRTKKTGGGTFSYGGQVASDSSQLAVYAIYKAWCQAGDDWLAQHYRTVEDYLAYSCHVQRAFDNAPDGIIRASDGDWYDFAYAGKYEREGASLFVNVLYLRALKYGSRMARAMGDADHAEQWQTLYDRGCERLSRPVAAGGLLLEDRGYLADTVQTMTDKHPNGWNYPRDLDKVTVLEDFRPIPHAVAIREGIVTDPAIVSAAVKCMDRFNMLRPFPGLVQYPWPDFMAAEGFSGPYEATPFGRKWKCLPGCQATGGRWGFAGGLMQLALWSAGEEALAVEARDNQARCLTLAHQPARVFEDAHWSGLFRNQAGDPKDCEGFYYNWGAATPIEAMVEGHYGVEPVPGGVRIAPVHCAIGDGISRVPIRGGDVSYARNGQAAWLVTVETRQPGKVEFVLPGGASADAATVEAGGAAKTPMTPRTEGSTLIVAYGEGRTELEIEC